MLTTIGSLGSAGFQPPIVPRNQDEQQSGQGNNNAAPVLEASTKPSPTPLPVVPEQPESISDITEGINRQAETVKNQIEAQDTEKATPDEKTAFFMAREALHQQELYAAVSNNTDDTSETDVRVEVQALEPSGVNPLAAAEPGSVDVIA